MNQQYNHLKPCVLCGSCDFKSRYKVRGYELFECCQCNLVFVNPLPSCEDLEYYYANQYAADLKSYMPVYSKHLQRKSKRLIKYLQNNIHENNKTPWLLEIGSSYGHFLNVAKSVGWHVKGVEIDEKAAKYAMNTWDVDTYIGTAEEYLEQTAKKFDIIVMSHVLEHLLDPFDIVKLIADHLEKNGYFVLTVPNIDSLASRINGKTWEWMIPPAHIFYFSPKTLEMTLQRSGFKIISLKTRKGDARDLIFELFIGLIKKSKFEGSIRKLFGRSQLSNTLPDLCKNPNLDNPFDRSNLVYRLCGMILYPLYVVLYPIILVLQEFNLGEEILIFAEKDS